MAERYTRRITLYINGQEVKNDIVSIRQAMRKLQNEQARMTIGSREYNAATANIKHLDSIVQKHRAGLRQTTSLWKRAGDAVNSYMGLAMGIVAAFAGVITIMKKFEMVS